MSSCAGFCLTPESSCVPAVTNSIDPNVHLFSALVYLELVSN